MEKSAYNKNEGCLRGGVKFSTGGIVHEQANACRACEIQAPTVTVRMKEDRAIPLYGILSRTRPAFLRGFLF